MTGSSGREACCSRASSRRSSRDAAPSERSPSQGPNWFLRRGGGGDARRCPDAAANRFPVARATLNYDVIPPSILYATLVSAPPLYFATLLCHSACRSPSLPIFPNPQVLPLSTYPHPSLLPTAYLTCFRYPSLFDKFSDICLFVCLIPSPFLFFDSHRVFVGCAYARVKGYASRTFRFAASPLRLNLNVGLWGYACSGLVRATDVQ